MSSAIERISALLIKAERTDNPREADAYLMTVSYTHLTLPTTPYV